ncbi:5-formyltetrahydrofolate cyclo-ligase [Proteiniborus sp. DW1]|uniref:5-formyltetrahydrofolate cyclo-ligase n=1 Tax=Proteiniborus sp. DW1 TaxID=1889883 RepID=UPI00092E045C|nr:5-formyltetrahydrofolate cyclo-ligase [Proteiniborus sp. DW1]SCG81760.1 5-formyltetrahydrofolate cyclo-ligase [Proteiniborus sp. DW1]
MIKYSKEDIRKEMTSLRNDLTKEYVNYLSQKIISTLLKLPIFKDSQNIMLYLSFGNEVDTFRLIEVCKEQGKKIIVPFCVKEGRQIVPTEIKNVEEDLVRTKFGYLQPKKELVRPVNTQEIDLILLPGLAFDRGCYRVSYGGGYYDRFLGKLNFTVPTIGLIYDFQLIDLAPIENHDIPVDYVITEKRIIIRTDERVSFKEDFMENQGIKNNEEKKIQKNICEECGSTMKPDSGCFICPNCGYSPCDI